MSGSPNSLLDIGVISLVIWYHHRLNRFIKKSLCCRLAITFALWQRTGQEQAVMNTEQTLSREIAGQKRNSVFCFQFKTETASVVSNGIIWRYQEIVFCFSHKITVKKSNSLSLGKLFRKFSLHENLVFFRRKIMFSLF